VRPKSTERLDALLSPGGSSTFISRREGLLGLLFLVLTVAILGILVYRFVSGGGEESETVAASAEPAPPATPAEPPPARATQPQPEPEPEPEPASEPASGPEAAPEPTPAAAPEPAPAEPQAPAPAASAAGGVLTAMRVTPLADRVDIFLEMPNAPPATSFQVDNPPRIVFDIPGARLLVPDSARNQTVDSPLIRRVRIAQNAFDPPLVRLVLEVDSFPSTAVSTSQVGLSIRVTPAP